MIERRSLRKMVEAMEGDGLLTVAVWVVANITVAAFLVHVAQVQVGKNGIGAILLINGILVRLSRPYWPIEQRKPPSSYDD